jgi:hypothetical protein
MARRFYAQGATAGLALASKFKAANSDASIVLGGIIPGLAYRGPFGPVTGGQGDIVSVRDEITGRSVPGTVTECSCKPWVPCPADARSSLAPYAKTAGV